MSERRQCPECKLYTNEPSKFCPHCAAPFPEAPPVAKSGAMKTRTWLLGIAGVIIALGVIGAIAGDKDKKPKQTDAAQASAPAQGAAPQVDVPKTPEPPKPTATPRPPEYRLALLSSNCLKDSIGYVTCKGFVKNISEKSIPSVEVVVVWVDKAGTPQSSGSGYVDYRPLLPGQEAPFTTIGKNNPALETYKVSLKEPFGATIAYRDDRDPAKLKP